MKRALIIGASSGMGRALAIILGKNGYEVGLMARRVERLQTLQNEISTKTYIGHIDITFPEEAIAKAEMMIEQMQSVDLIVLNAGVYLTNVELDWVIEKQTIAVNVTGFCALADLSYNYFVKRGGGHIVGLSSISALRGDDLAPGYAATKAFVSNYLEGLRVKAYSAAIPITVTDIKPGFVDTGLVQVEEEPFWVAKVQEAVDQIYRGIQAKKKLVYITHRWRLIAWVMQLAPDWFYFPIASHKVCKKSRR